MAGPLWDAADRGDTRELKRLLEISTEELDQKQGELEITPLYAAVDQSHLEVVKILLEHQANANLTTREGASPLYIAAEIGSLDLVIALLQVDGIKVDQPTIYGDTPLLIAVQEGYLEITAALIGAGADFSVRNLRKNTPLILASQEGHASIVRLLLDLGANPNEARTNEKSALHLAAIYNHIDVVNELLTHRNILINRLDHSAKTPLVWAEELLHESIAKRLRNADDIFGSRAQLNPSY